MGKRRHKLDLAFVDRPPSDCELERIRLILSTYQDGTGMWDAKVARGQKVLTLPGWRDFERAVAVALGGQASESKEVFDIVLARADAPEAKRYGLSCKMRSELNRIARDGRVTIEVSNSSGKFWDHLAGRGITHSNYRDQPRAVGIALSELVHLWHATEAAARGLDLRRCSYLVLSWNRGGLYQLHQFALGLFDPRDLDWHFPTAGKRAGRRVCGDDSSGTLVEWYGESGGQLKYYPQATEALWHSDPFRLEPLPADTTHGILRKAADYFPDLWQRACGV